MDNVMFACNGPRGGMSIPLQRVTSLRLHAQANVPAVSYCKRPVLDDGTRHRAGGAGRRGRSLQCTTALLCSLLVYKIGHFIFR